MNYLIEAQNIYNELVDYRRTLHMNPEVGFELPNTVKFVTEKLTDFGYDYEVVKDSGVIATVGSGGKVIMLRADMDALPIKEQSGEKFSSTNDYMHACGHDFHTTTLLGAAKLLKQNEENLEGTVKLLFQPAEELLVGGEVMVEAGVLENPKVDAALGLHVNSTFDQGIYTHAGVTMASANNFNIIIKGKGSHGAMPNMSVDPVNIGAHIVVRAQEIIARELPVNENVVITMGKFEADGAINVIPEEVTIEGTLRTFSTASQDYAKKRLVEIVEETAKTFRGEATLEYLSDVPILETDPLLTDDLVKYSTPLAEQAGVPMKVAPVMSGSEDFAHITSRVPSAHFWIGTPHLESDEHYNLHHPKVRFDEEQLPLAISVMSEFATNWLRDNK